MTVLDGILQGLLQGFTEFLPVSSSGHLSLYQYFTGTSGEESLFFNLMLHLGTLAAVIAVFYDDLWKMLKELGHMAGELFRGEFRLATDNPSRKLLYMLFLACLPMVLVLPFHSLVGQIAGDKDIVVEGVCFLITSALLFMACKMKPGRAGVRRMKPKHAFIIGGAQALAVMPGISRSGATISTGLILGFDRAFMVKFSFLLGIPAILGGAVVEAKDVIDEGVAVDFWPIFAGVVTAALAGYASILLVRWLLLSDKFVIFAWYTLILGAIVLIVGIVGHLMGGGSPAEAGSAAGSLSQAVSDISSAVSGAGSASLPPT